MLMPRPLEFTNGALTLRQGRKVQESQARNLAITRIRVPVTKDLQGSTDCKERATGLDRTLQTRIGANSPIFTRENDFDAPRRIHSQAVDALSRGDIEKAKGLLIDRTTRYMNARFHREIEEDNWEYSAWTRWKRVARRYEPISSIATLSTPSASYKIATSRVPSSYLAPPCTVRKQRSDPEQVELEGYYQTMLWCELANYFNL